MTNSIASLRFLSRVSFLPLFYLRFSIFSALKHLEEAAAIQEEVLDTHEEMIQIHQALSVVLRGLGKDEEAEREMKKAEECVKKLDPLEVPLGHEEWVFPSSNVRR